MRFLIQCGDHFENQTRIKSLVVALIECGHEPVVLVYKEHKGRLFRNLGAKTISIASYFEKPTVAVAAGLKINDLAVGDKKYGDIIRIEGLRRPNILWPGQIKKTLRDVNIHIKAVTAILDQIKPDHCIIWNGFTGYTANVLRAVCEVRRIPNAFLERGLLKNSLFIDRDGVNGASSLRHLSASLIDSYIPTEEERHFAQTAFKLSTSPQVQRPVNGGAINVFFPMQVQHDTNIILYCPFGTMRECLLAIDEELRTRLGDGYKIAIRPHPEEDPAIDSNVPRTSNFTFDRNLSLADSINESDIVITINSTVGLEALIAGRPVVSLGGSIYSNCGLTYSLQSIRRSGNLTVNQERLIKYLCYILSNNLLLPGKSETNRLVICKQLGIKAPDVAQSHTPREENPINTNDLIIYLDLDFSETLDLSYRKNSVPIDRQWILDLSLSHFSFDSFQIKHIREYQHKAASSLLIRSEKSTKPDMRFTKNIDVYGNLIT